MPVEIESLRDGKVIVVRLSGTLCAEDYARFTPSVEAAVQQHGTIRIVVAMSDFHGWKMAALWEDIKFEDLGNGLRDKLRVGPDYKSGD